MEKKGAIGTGIQRWRISVLVMLLGGFMLACTLVYTFLPDQKMTVYIPVEGPAQQMQLELEKEGPIEIKEMEPYKDGYIRVELAARPGEEGPYTEQHLYFHEKGQEERLYSMNLRVDQFGNVLDMDRGNFEGYEWVLLNLALFFLAGAISAFLEFIWAIQKDYYDYRAIFRCGMAFFLAGVTITLLVEWVRMLLDPVGVSRWDVLNFVADSGYSYMLFSLPFLVSFALSQTLSNLALIRHEGMRTRNIIGMILGVCLIGGVALGVFLHQPVQGSVMVRKTVRAMYSIYTTGFVFLEAMLIGTIICALLAVRHVPERNKDFLVILGCGFAPDGHLYPLLRGRVDKAIEFWKLQLSQTGKRAIFVPSGGQGPKEPMSEARAMANYLLSQGFTEQDMILEDRSRNTYQNMAFSKELIEKEKPDSQPLFVTTNYHCFRSGILARKVGFLADGLGSRTKWYFWPNAFVREFIGLLVAQRRREIGVLIVMVAVYAGISFAVG